MANYVLLFDNVQFNGRRPADGKED